MQRTINLHSPVALVGSIFFAVFATGSAEASGGKSAVAEAKVHAATPCPLLTGYGAVGDGAVRVATFNAFLNRPGEGDLLRELAGRDSPQVQAVSEIIQRVRPDILLLNEVDRDREGKAAELLQKNYLSVAQRHQQAIEYPYRYFASANTGVDSALDLDGDGRLGEPEDAYGYGAFPGQYGMLLLSRYPIETTGIRTFQNFLWKDMPGALIPVDYYPPEAQKQLRLSSKSHWDIPVNVDGEILHILAAHPTPPVFDGPEDRNGRRNHDEIRFWADYVRGENYFYDDQGRDGALEMGARFVILGDYNADPYDGDTRNNAIWQLLKHPDIAQDRPPGSDGARRDAESAGYVNVGHRGNPAYDTGDFNPKGSGNLRLDYVLPSKHGITPRCASVFWPAEGQEGWDLVGEGYPVISSDHHLVWMDLDIDSLPRE
ncbi:endonuclease/exonuclease/phosphatase family protein [Microbulbifer bruguierae]|uniref:Endonuclease/exonuclease/phosphatase family protein n=1 Tax=Microbulbifer bruguierae TaxID=3029061 RepID=A0ABY8NF18_9GAMM|nr:endonuclease/exonuclease/phosphatase family protein [Microbulbifer bruguierae]WGL17187.1 endonuclease/exonuclease/phosphatase family protein [Microbulbifer bruguierae]